MTRQQFRLLVIANQLLMFAGYIVRDMTDGFLPPELQSYAFASLSVLDDGFASAADEVLFWFWRAADLASVAAAIGLCLARRWGRTLYLICFCVSVLGTFLLYHITVSTNWPGLLFSLYGTTEGMILGLAYFSHLKRMFDQAESVDPVDE